MMIDTGPKFYSAILIALAHGLKVKVKNFKLRNFISIKVFKELIFSKPYDRFGSYLE